MEKMGHLLPMIRELREYLERLISDKESMVDPEIIAVSKVLDILLNEYERLLREKEAGR